MCVCVDVCCVHVLACSYVCMFECDVLSCVCVCVCFVLGLSRVCGVDVMRRAGGGGESGACERVLCACAWGARAVVSVLGGVRGSLNA